MCFEVLKYNMKESRNIYFDLSFVFDPLPRDIINNRSNADEIRFIVYYFKTIAFVPKTEKLQPLALNIPH